MMEYFFKYRNRVVPEPSFVIISSFALLMYSGLSYGGLYQNKTSFLLYYAVFFPFLFLLYLSLRKKISVNLIFAITCIVYLFGALLTVIFSPNPVCDCFTTVRESALFFLDGKNPYNSLFSPVYQGVVPDYFPHLPFSFIFVSPFVVFFKDPRFATIFASLASAFVLRRLLREKLKDNGMNVIIAGFFFLPRSFYMLEHMYQEISMFFFFLLFIYLFKRKKEGFSMLSLALFFSFKQHLLLFLPIFLLHSEMRKVLLRNLKFFLLPWVIPLLYLIGNPQAFIRNIFFFASLNTFTNALPLSNSLSLSTFIHQLSGIPLPRAQIISVLIFLLAYFGILRIRRGIYKPALVLLLLIHLTLSYSFFNHYYLVTLLMMFYTVSVSLKIGLPFEAD